MNIEDMQGLLQFAVGRQRELIEACIDAGSVTGGSAIAGMEHGNARRAIKAVRRKAAQQGYAPQHDMVKTVPDGFNLKGTSTLYDDNGNQRLQWVKTAADRERQTQILLEALEAGSTSFKQFKPTKAPKHSEADLLTMLTITDFHLGMYAWEAETGDDWDVYLSREVFLNSIHDMIQASPNSAVGMLNQLGDFLHWDGLLAITPSSGHILDADTRYAKLVDLTMDVMAEAVRMMLKKFGEVRVIQAEGNHDMAGSVWIRKHLKHLFANEPRVKVDDTEFPFYAYLWGDNMLAMHHGHKMKLGTLPKLFASEPRYRSMWGKANQTYIHTGHYHHERVIEDGGAIVEQHPSLSGRDAYAARGGYVSRRGAKTITYHKTEGETARFTVRPRRSK